MTWVTDWAAWKALAFAHRVNEGKRLATRRWRSPPTPT